MRWSGPTTRSWSASLPASAGLTGSPSSRASASRSGSCQQRGPSDAPPTSPGLSDLRTRLVQARPDPREQGVLDLAHTVRPMPPRHRRRLGLDGRQPRVGALPMTTPVPMNVVLRKDAEVAARVAYATGRRDAMLSFAEELQILSGQFLAVDDVIDAVAKAASEFNDTITRLQEEREVT